MKYYNLDVFDDSHFGGIIAKSYFNMATEDRESGLKILKDSVLETGYLANALFGVKINSYDRLSFSFNRGPIGKIFQETPMLNRLSGKAWPVSSKVLALEMELDNLNYLGIFHDVIKQDGIVKIEKGLPNKMEEFISKHYSNQKDILLFEDI